MENEDDKARLSGREFWKGLFFRRGCLQLRLEMRTGSASAIASQLESGEKVEKIMQIHV
jgi:hypothetical protein